MAYARLLGANPPFSALVQRAHVILGNGTAGMSGGSWMKAAEAVLGGFTLPPGVAVGDIDVHLGDGRIAVGSCA